jgi:hypothetical protein
MTYSSGTSSQSVMVLVHAVVLSGQFRYEYTIICQVFRMDDYIIDGMSKFVFLFVFTFSSFYNIR